MTYTRLQRRRRATLVSMYVFCGVLHPINAVLWYIGRGFTPLVVLEVGLGCTGWSLVWLFRRTPPPRKP
jgi:hypothetical protein